MTNDNTGPTGLSENYRRSSYCGTNACVEVAVRNGAVHMRDSKNPKQTPINFSTQAWQAFLAGVAAGEFDRP